MSRLDWRRARPHREQESKYGVRAQLKNGAVTAPVTKNNLALRAERELRAWERTLRPRDRDALRQFD
jgi:hypothetical protein